MEDTNRVQFRLKRGPLQALDQLAAKENMSRNHIAKLIVERALSGNGQELDYQEEDLLIARAGIQRLFERSNTLDELSESVEGLKAQRQMVLKRTQGASQ